MPHKSFNPNLAAPWVKIVSYPDHKGQSLTGVIVEVNTELNELLNE